MTVADVRAEFIAYMTDLQPLILVLCGFALALRSGRWFLSLFRSSTDSRDVG